MSVIEKALRALRRALTGGACEVAPYRGIWPVHPCPDGAKATQTVHSDCPTCHASTRVRVCDRCAQSLRADVAYSRLECQDDPRHDAALKIIG